jgi:hypothetical protein
MGQDLASVIDAYGSSAWEGAWNWGQDCCSFPPFDVPDIPNINPPDVWPFAGSGSGGSAGGQGGTSDVSGQAGDTTTSDTGGNSTTGDPLGGGNPFSDFPAGDVATGLACQTLVDWLRGHGWTLKKDLNKFKAWTSSDGRWEVEMRLEPAQNPLFDTSSVPRFSIKELGGVANSYLDPWTGLRAGLKSAIAHIPLLDVATCVI